jgi:hypothetical protein
LLTLTPRRCVQVAEEIEVLRDGQILIEAEALRHVADAGMSPRGIHRHVMAKDGDAARSRAQQACDQPQQGRLAGAIRPDQASDHPRLDLRRNTRQRDVLSGKDVPQILDDGERHRATGSAIVIGMPWRMPSSAFSTRMRRR